MCRCLFPASTHISKISPFKNNNIEDLMNKAHNSYGFHYSFYSDLLLSLRYFFNTIILKSDVIKSYEFNLGDRSFQLDYSTQHELPAAIINYRNSVAVSYHPYVFQRTNFDNINRIPVLYNRTKELELDLQEELHQISLDIVINCDSQLQALEIEQMINHYSPIGKYFQHYRFYSFIKIDNQFIHPDIFDVNNDLIYNLFIKHNRRQDAVDYCFSVEYNPLIRFESCQAELSSSEQRSFTVSCPVTIVTPIPVFQMIPNYQKSLSNKPVRTYNRSDIIVSTGSSDLLLVSFTNHSCVAVVQTTDSETGEFAATFTYNDSTYTITGFIETEEIVCDGNITVNNQVKVTCTFTVIKNLLENTYTISVSGPIDATLTHAEYDLSANQLTGYLSTTFNNEPIEAYITVDDLNILRQSKILSTNFTVTDNITRNIKFVSVLNLYNTNLDLSIHRMALQTDNSYITTLIVTDSLYNQYIVNLDSDSYISINSKGSFNGSLTFTINQQSITLVLMGKVNSKTGQLTYDALFSDDNYNLAALYFNLQFKTGNYYGVRVIERQSLLSTFTNELISTDSGLTVSQDLFDNQTIGAIKQSNGRLLRTTIITDENITIPSDNSKVLITVVFDELFNYNSYSSNHFWRFIFHNQIFTSNDEGAISFKQASETYELQFEADKVWFYGCFNGVSSDNPIFFQFFVV
jgi:hypothetical protein